MKEYTVKQIADLLKVSKPSIQKIITEYGIEPIRIYKGKFRIYDHDDSMKVIYAAIERYGLQIPQIDTANDAKQTANSESDIANTTNETANDENSIANTENTDSVLYKTDKLHQKYVKSLENAIEELRRELNEIRQGHKEETDFFRSQLVEKDKQITSLQNTLELAEQNLARSQQLHAADKQRLLALESRAETPSDAQMENQGCNEEDDIWESVADKEDISEEKGTQAVFVGFTDDEAFESNEQVAEPAQEAEVKRGFFSRLWKSIIN